MTFVTRWLLKEQRKERVFEIVQAQTRLIRTLIGRLPIVVCLLGFDFFLLLSEIYGTEKIWAWRRVEGKMSLYFEVILFLAGCRFQVGLINNQVLSLDLDMKCTYSQYLINGHVWIIVFFFSRFSLYLSEKWWSSWTKSVVFTHANTSLTPFSADRPAPLAGHGPSAKCGNLGPIAPVYYFQCSQWFGG